MFLQNQELVIAGLAAFVVFLLLIFFIFLISTAYNKRQRETTMQMNETKIKFEETILRTQLEIQEQTLKTISQEIHDNIGQMLSLAKLNLALAKTELPDQPRIIDSHQLVSKSIQDLRDISRSLNTDFVVQTGLQESIEYELNMIAKTGILKTQLTSSGTSKRLDPQKELILFRIVQESFNNILKHANATELTIQLLYEPDSWKISIHDNGQGVDLRSLNEHTNHQQGLGIRNMHNRAKLIGADFQINSILGQGTTVSIHLPQS